MSASLSSLSTVAIAVGSFSIKAKAMSVVSTSEGPGLLSNVGYFLFLISSRPAFASAPCLDDLVLASRSSSYTTVSRVEILIGPGIELLISSSRSRCCFNMVSRKLVSRRICSGEAGLSELSRNLSLFS